MTEENLLAVLAAIIILASAIYESFGYDPLFYQEGNKAQQIL